MDFRQVGLPVASVLLLLSGSRQVGHRWDISVTYMSLSFMPLLLSMQLALSLSSSGKDAEINSKDDFSRRDKLFFAIETNRA